jgi:hypothetical protein
VAINPKIASKTKKEITHICTDGENERRHHGELEAIDAFVRAYIPRKVN